MTESENEILFRELQSTFRRLKHLHMGPAMPPHEDLKGLTPGEMHLMHAIIKKGLRGEKIRPADLAENRHMTPQALSPMLRKLEEAGFITRRMSNSDRRVSYIEPTEKGIKLSKKIDSMFDAQMRDLVEYLGEEDVKSLIAILHKVGRYADERQGAGGFPHACHQNPHAPIEGKEETN